MAEVSPAKVVREAISNLELPTTPSEIVRYVRKKNPGIDESRIRSQVTACCVNMPTRTSFPENRSPRIANDPDLDCLFRVDFGQYAAYNPEEHGVWEIADADGELIVRITEGPGAAGAKPEPEGEPAEVAAAPPKINARAKRVADEPEPEAGPRAKGAKAPAEPEPMEGDDDMPPKDADLANMLKENLGMLEEGLKPYPDQSAMGKFPRPLSPHDLLLADGGGNMVVVKIFGEPPGHDVVSDLLINMGWAHENVEKKQVRAIVLTPKVPDELRYSAKSVPGMKLMTFEYKLVFTAV